MAKIKISELRLSYENNKEVVYVPNMQIEDGDIVGFFGPNHVGKSTLLKALVRTANKLKINNLNSIIYKKFTGNLVTVYMPQDYNSSIYPWFSIKKNINLLMEAYKLSKNEISNRLNNFYNDIGFKSELDFFLEYGFAKKVNGNIIVKKITELSGGQKQIISILRSVVISPDILALDEPFAAIDIFNKGLKFRNDILKYIRKNKITTIIVSHNLEEIIDFTDTLFIFNYNTNNQIFLGEENSNIKKDEYPLFVNKLNTKYNLNLVL